MVDRGKNELPLRMSTDPAELQNELPFKVITDLAELSLIVNQFVNETKSWAEKVRWASHPAEAWPHRKLWAWKG